MKLSKSFFAMGQALCLLLVSAFAMPAAVTNVELARVHTATQVALNGGTNGCAVSGASVTTGTTPSIITCVAAHNLVSGDQVQITGIVGTTTDNVTGWVTVLSPTTFAIYNNVNMQSTQGIIGTGSYVSGGYVTEALDVSAISQPWTIRLRVDALSAATQVVVLIQNSSDGINWTTLETVPISAGSNAQTVGIDHTFPWYQVPQSFIGIMNGRLRVAIQSITSGGSVTTSLLLQN
jgi:hypothetical protein